MSIRTHLTKHVDGFYMASNGWATGQLIKAAAIAVGNTPILYDVIQISRSVPSRHHQPMIRTHLGYQITLDTREAVHLLFSAYVHGGFSFEVYTIN